jgi:glycosyltransferase involved in cell wall biosynthesis
MPSTTDDHPESGPVTTIPRRRLVAITVAATHPPRRGKQYRAAALLQRLSDEWEVESHSLTIQRTDLPIPRRSRRVTPRWTDHRVRDPVLVAWVSLLARFGYGPAYIDRVLDRLPRRRLRRALAAADAVWVSLPDHYLWVRRATPARIPTALDEDCIAAHLYPAREDAPLTEHIAAEIDRVERAALTVADLVLVTHDEDAQASRRRGAAAITCVPNGVDLTRFAPAGEGERRQARRALGLADDACVGVFVGSGHPPNVQAVDVLLGQAAGYAGAGVQVVVAGRCGLHRRSVPGVTVLGEVPDVVRVLHAADIALCPLLEGSGTSIKTIEYLAAGLPVVSTPVGVRGLDLVAGTEVEVCDVAQMPSRTAELAGDAPRRASLATAGRAVAERRFSWDASARTLSDALAQMVDSGRRTPPTVLFVGSSAELYGADLCLERLVLAHRAAGGRALVALPDDGPLAGRLVAAGVPVQVLPLAVLRRRLVTPLGAVQVAGALLSSRVRLARLARREGVELVHSNSAAVLSGAAVARAAGVPHVWHLREYLTADRRSLRLLAAVLERGSTRVVATSGPVRDALLRLRPALANRTAVVPDGVDPDRFAALPDRAAVARRYGLDPRRPTVGMLARINAWKGQEVLLEALAQMGPAAPAVQLVLAGDVYPGDEHIGAALRRQVGLAGLGDSVVFPGFVDPRDVLAISDIIIAPSTRPEPFGLAVVDALTAGRPVIASAHGGHLELVRDGVDGLLVPPGDARALADAVLRLLTDAGLCRRMAATARRDRRRFSLDASLPAMWAVYGEALAGS